MALAVEHPGVRATVQDQGRPGFRAWGVPAGGAFDRASHALANALVGNRPDAATLELTLFGGSYRAETPLALALAGARMAARIEAAGQPTRPLVIPQSFSLQPGDRLILGGSATGARAYLAVLGGWLTPLILGGRSSETPLRAGDRLAALPGLVPSRRPAPIIEPDGPLRLVLASESAGIDADWWAETVYRVSPHCDRMGLRLDGPPLVLASSPDRPSAPVVPGSIQWAGGLPIVLGPAGGTMGGYPVVGHVISADLDRLGQARPGDSVRFQPIPIDEARRLHREHRGQLSARLLRLRILAGDR